MSNTKNHSITSVTEQVMRLNQNSVEIVSKLDDVLHSNEESINITVTDENGAKYVVALPTVGKLKSDIEAIKANIRVLSGMEGGTSLLQTSENTFKKIILSDLNREPNNIDVLNTVETFRSNSNWFLDSMLNPALSVELDLSGKIQDNVRKILSRRFIVEFERDADNNYELTTAGATRKQEFETKYKGKNNIDIVEFVTWLDQTGIANRANPFVDEQVFDLEPSRLQYRGNFTVLTSEEDLVNKKFWYVFDTLNYQDISNQNAAPIVKTLQIGDLLMVNPVDDTQTASTVYKVIETSTASSQLKVRVELVEGLDPIAPRANALSIYSPVVLNKNVRITVGFDEYNVIFIKSLNSSNNLISKDWSMGIGYYTSELRLDTTSGEVLSDYYVKNVYDYGMVLRDLVAQKIPVSHGETPNPVLLNSDNFKVVQINKHLTDNADAEEIRNLNNTKNNLKSEIDQLADSIDRQKNYIQVTKFKSEADKNIAETELQKLTDQLNSKNTLYATTLSKILAAQKNVNNVSPKFRVRGFWAMPDAKLAYGTQPQEVVQFLINYRYTNKAGSSAPVDIFKKVDATKDGAFSNWNAYKTDSRRRSYDEATGTWTWVIEDISDADTPNINQLDISIQPGEQVEVRIKALSEVGWPDAPIESDWSETLTIAFPDDLNNVTGEDQFILQEATQEDLTVKMKKELNAQGLGKILGASVSIADKFYTSSSRDVLYGVEDNIPVNLYEKMAQLINRIAQLEEQISRAKGELKVTLIRAGIESTVLNESSYNYVIELENYVKTAQNGTIDAPFNPPNTRTYKNEVTVLKDFYLRIENFAASSALSILSNRLYTDSTSYQNNSNFAFSASNAQGTFVNANDILLSDNTDNGGIYNPRYIRTQKDNQWLWLQNLKPDGTEIYNSSASTSDTALPTNAQIHDVLVDRTAGNFGLRPAYTTSTITGLSTLKISDSNYWNAYFATPSTTPNFPGTIHPQVTSLESLVETGSQKLKLIQPGVDNSILVPLNIYWKFTTVNNMFDGLLSTSVASGGFNNDKDNQNLVLQGLMQELKLDTTGIANSSNPLVNFAPNGTADTALTGAASTTYTGSIGSALTAPTVGSSDTITTTINGSSESITGSITIVNGTYYVGNIILLGGSNTGKFVVTGITGGVAYLIPVRLKSFVTMGLSVGDMIMFDGIDIGMTQMNNKYARITSIDSDPDPAYIKVSVNTAQYTPFDSGDATTTRIALLTKVSSLQSAVTGIVPAQVWNSIGRDSTTNTPLNQSLFVVNDSLGNATAPEVKRSLRFYIEPENMTRAFQFTLNFTLRQYKNTQIALSNYDLATVNTSGIFNVL